MKLFLTAIIAILFTTINAQELIYVKANATGDGTSWQTAADLQTALDLATEGAHIWVAKGTHLPTEAGDRSASFIIDKNIKIYGGFNGNETSISQRDTRINKTILSGEIASNKIEDNSYTVVTIEGATSEMVLDGFTITAGMADGSTLPGNKDSLLIQLFVTVSFRIISLAKVAQFTI